MNKNIINVKCVTLFVKRHCTVTIKTLDVVDIFRMRKESKFV